MAEVGWSRRSLLDVRDIHTYIAQYDPGAADRMAGRLRDAGNGLHSFPNRARVHSGKVRVLATVRPYLIFYKVEREAVTIVTIRHSRRRPLP